MRIRNIFIKETSDNLSVLEEQLLKPEDVIHGNMAVDMVIMTMHNIKGTAPMVGFNELSLIATPVEQVYKELRERKVQPDDCLIEKTREAVYTIQELLSIEESELLAIEDKQKNLIDFFNDFTCG